ncbi:MAG: glutamate 5-kinase [Gammaproteobacteria bacterium]|nr:glutamate 5-kinase [Gammaproteobacteria bacterium]
MSREALKQAKRIVVKIGSSLLTDNGKGLDRDAISLWVQQIAELTSEGVQVLLVSSGSVVEGMARLGWSKRPHQLCELQAAASIGQMGLVQAYESLFQEYQLHTAQVLLTHDDLSDRRRYLNARSTLLELLNLNVIPVINENDTVATDEIRFGDNDTLAALVANLVSADVLIILTDQAGLFDKNPAIYDDAKLIELAQANDPVLEQMAGGSTSGLGRGGMVTKVQAASLASRSGATTIIANGREADVLQRLLAAEQLGTILIARDEPLLARKRWLAGQLKIKGKIVLDDGAVRVLENSGKSLLPIGVEALEGEFRRGDLVACHDREGREVARGLVNYNADEVRVIKRKSSRQIEGLLGYAGDAELIHRDNLVLLGKKWL